MKRVKLIVTIGALAILPAGASEAWSQGEGSRARKEFEITWNVIEKVKRIVEESGNRRAEDPLRRAMEVQRRAERELDRNAAVSGMRLTLIAREYAKRAAKIAGELSENKEFVFRQLERTREILRRVSEEAGGRDQERFRDLLNNAFERQAQAETSFREQRFRVALRMTQLARELAHKALELTRGEPGAGPERVRAALGRTDEVLGRVTRDLQGDRPPLLEEAYRLQDRAEHHLEEGRPAPALKLTLTARDLAGRAMREAIEGDGAAAVGQEIEATRDFLAGAEELARDSGSEEAMALVRKGYQHLNRAEDHFAGEDYMAARAELKVARRSAERAVEVAGGR